MARSDRDLNYVWKDKTIFIRLAGPSQCSSIECIFPAGNTQQTCQKNILAEVIN